MQRVSWSWESAVLTVFAGALCLSGVDTVTKQKLSPPSNLMATVKDLFVVNWTWDALSNLPSGTKCDLKYLSDLNGERVRSPDTFRNDTPHDINKEICFKVQSVCMDNNDISIQSTWVENCTFLLKGNLEPPVKDFRCKWYSDEPMECTWQLNKDTPPDVKYTLIYRYKEVNNQCQAYTYEEGVVNGCTFIKETFLKENKINILITDRAMTLGRFYTSLEPVSILKPRPLNITVSKLSDNRLHVEWYDSKFYVKDYEVQWKNSKSENWTTNSVSRKYKYTTDNIHPDSKYTVRVRSKFDPSYGGKVWSEWSTEANIGEHREDDVIFPYLLLFTIPLALATATILLLVFMKRLKVLIFPPIPDPGKLFIRLFPDHNEERKHWIQHDSAMFPDSPTKEEICSVVLVETETSHETQNG